MDAAISTLVCQGVVNNYHSGIGGGAFMVIYDQKTNQKKYINCREKAPLASDRSVSVKIHHFDWVKSSDSDWLRL